MARYKPYKYDQMVLVPVSFQEQLEPGTFEYTLNELVEKHLDLSVFEARYQNDHTGARAIHPEAATQSDPVRLFAWHDQFPPDGTCLSENVLFMALSGGSHPDHSTLAHFVSSMHKEIQSLFTNILLVCDELNLLGGTHFSLDGVKLPSNASKEWSGTFKELRKKRNKLKAKLQQVIHEHIRQDKKTNVDTDKQQHQEQRLLQQLERLNEFLQEEEPKIGKSGKEIQSNVTDNESAKMPTSHGVIQGYNAQALVDEKHQVIVHAETGGSQDHNNLDPMLKGAKKNMQAIGKKPEYFHGKQFTADSNYYCLANLALCQSEGLDAYIPDIQFRKRDPRFLEQLRFKNGIHARRRPMKKDNEVHRGGLSLRCLPPGLCLSARQDLAMWCTSPTKPLPGLRYLPRSSAGLCSLSCAISVLEQAHHLTSFFIHGSGQSPSQPHRTHESSHRHT